MPGETDSVEWGQFTIPVPAQFKEWALNTENWAVPYFDTLLFLIDIWPVMFMCNILSETVYQQYDEITMELECLNKAF